MPPRLFPYALRVGTDICSIARIRNVVADNDAHKVSNLRRFLPKLLTWPEQQYFWDRFKDDQKAYDKIHKVSQFLAGRWAAKEACRKACEHMNKSNGFHSIMIFPITPSDETLDKATVRPQGLILRDRLPARFVDPSLERTQDGAHRRQFDIDEVDGQFCEVSISHDTDYATATAIVPVVEEWGDHAGKETDEDNAVDTWNRGQWYH